MFYKSYNFAINILGIEDEDKKKKQSIWRDILRYTAKNDLYRRNESMEKLSDYIAKDMIIVSQALVVVREQAEEEGLNESTLWRKGCIGFPVYAIEEY